VNLGNELTMRGSSQRIAQPTEYGKAPLAAGSRSERTDFGNATGSMGKGDPMDTEPGGELITVQVAADRLAVSRWMVYQLIWDGRVKSVQIGRCRRIVRQSLDDYLSGLIEGAA
jgi:excisionase family DNA binding protein